MKVFLVFAVAVIALSIPPVSGERLNRPGRPVYRSTGFYSVAIRVVHPRGWILEQMRRNLERVFRASRASFVTRRKSNISLRAEIDPDEAMDAIRPAAVGGTAGPEGDQHCGHFMLACLSSELDDDEEGEELCGTHPRLAEDADGYIGIYFAGTAVHR